MLLLTGATGLVGSTLLRPPAGRRAPRSRCLVRDPRRLGAQRVRVQIALGDLTDPPSFRNALRGVQTVVHLAASIRDQPRGSIEELERHRDLADGRGGGAPGRRALRVLLGARRLHPPPHALPARQGPGRAGGARGGRALDRVRAVDRLRPRRPLAHAAGAPGAAAGHAGLRAGPRRVPADLGGGRGRLRDRRAARARRSAARALRAGRAGDAQPQRHRADAPALAEPQAPAAARAHPDRLARPAAARAGWAGRACSPRGTRPS